MRVVFYLHADDKRSSQQKAQSLDRWISFVSSQGPWSITMILTEDCAEGLLLHSSLLESVEIVFHPTQLTNTPLEQWRSVFREHADWAIFVDLRMHPEPLSWLSDDSLAPLAMDSKEHVFVKDKSLNFLSTPWVVTRRGRDFLMTHSEIHTPQDPRLQRTQLASSDDNL